MQILIQLALGALGGNLAGMIFKKLNLGLLWNSVAGIIGGGIGGQILGATGLTASLGESINSVLGGGVGGAVVLVIVAVIKNLMGKK